jgi:hypothetical protein
MLGHDGVLMTCPKLDEEMKGGRMDVQLVGLMDFANRLLNNDIGRM